MGEAYIVRVGTPAQSFFSRVCKSGLNAGQVCFVSDKEFQSILDDVQIITVKDADEKVVVEKKDVKNS